jgi:histidine ammonia-lyase
MTAKSGAVVIGGGLTLEDVDAVARGAPVEISQEARGRIARARAEVEMALARGADGPRVYGVNTGFGALAEVAVHEEKIRELQKNLVRSHACGVGPAFDEWTVRAILLTRAQVLALGHSGVRPALVEMLVAMLDAGVHPVIPEQGSVGASGDLAPLAHLALSMIGEGEAFYRHERLPSAEALRAAGLPPLVLDAKEGISLINGTQVILAVGTDVVLRGERLGRLADVSGAMSLEALQGSHRPFDARIATLRPHPGHAASAANLRRILAGSGIVETHADCRKVQDPYSLRCMPQVHGATRDALAYARGALSRELVAVTDNPILLFADDGSAEFVSGGNFHGQPLGIPLDAASVGIAELANVAERRIEQLVNPALSSGLPPFLAAETGLHSGFMMAQVTAAALVSENKTLCHPASVDSIPSSAGKEDHVSMATWAARKARRVAEHVETVLAIEMLAAAQGLDLRRPAFPGKGALAAHEAIRKVVPTLDGDRALHADIEKVVGMIRGGEILRAVEAEVGALE